MPEAARPLWTFQEALEASGGRAEGDALAELAINSVSIDSRTLEKGALFAAIRGENHDGHDFVEGAFAAGAVCALVAEGSEAEGLGPLIRVADTLSGLQRLGIAARTRVAAEVIAVTGSVGKTGTKEALRLALTPSGLVHASEKSHNNQWGVPLSLANMRREAAFGVFEVGMNHPGEIAPLAQMIRPHVAVVTAVEPVHLEFFNSVEQIAEAKAEIFAGLERGGTAVLNRDNPHFARLAAHARDAGAGYVVGFGVSEAAEARVLDVVEDSEGSDVRADICGVGLAYRISAPGRHLVMNSLAVLAALQAAGGDLSAGAKALAAYRAPPGRGARLLFTLPTGSVVLIDESYNANPASMRAALATLGAMPRSRAPRRIAVLGDMLELGAASDELHRSLAAAVDAAAVDVVFACGPHMRALFESLPKSRRGAYAETSDGLKAPLLRTVAAGDVVMIKGSLGSRMKVLVEALQERLSQ